MNPSNLHIGRTSGVISGIISVNDYLCAQRLNRKSTHKRSLVFAEVLASCGFAVMLVDVKWGVVVLGAGVGAFLGEYLCANLVLPRKAKKLHAQRKELANEVIYSWDAEHLEAKSSIGVSKMPWSHFVKMKEDENGFLLYVSDNLFQMFPKAWFPGEDAIDGFRKLAARIGEM